MGAQPVQQPKKRRGRPPKVKTANGSDPGPKPDTGTNSRISALKGSPYRRPPVPHRGQPQIVSVSLRLDPTAHPSTPPSLGTSAAIVTSDKQDEMISNGKET